MVYRPDLKLRIAIGDTSEVDGRGRTDRQVIAQLRYGFPGVRQPASIEDP